MVKQWLCLFLVVSSPVWALSELKVSLDKNPLLLGETAVLELVADDQVLIEDGRASPPRALAGLLEVRGLGILRITHQAPVTLMLVLALDDASMSAAEPESSFA